MPEELKKIDLVTTEPKIEIMQQKKSHKWVFIIIIPLLVVVVLIGILGIMLLPLKSVVAKSQKFMVTARQLGAAAKTQDLVAIKSGLAQVRTDLTDVKAEYQKVLPLGGLPFVGTYIKDGQHAINAAFAGLTAGDRALEALEPNADILGLKGKSTFVSGSADDRIQVAVKTMTALTPKINEMAGSIDTLRKELNGIDPNHYPEQIGDKPVRKQLIAVKEVIENAANLFVNAQPLLVSLPKILGEPTEKRYLVLFLNDKELRPTGGFITAYAQFRLIKGKAILEKSDDIYSLDAAISKKFPAPPEILKFHKGVYELHIRDSNISPDFKLSMQQFEKMYDQSSGHEKIDGIWAMDTHVLVEILKILGPESISGRVFSAEIDKRCDCPRAVYELEDYSSRPVNYVRTARKDIIGVLLQNLLHKALGVSPSKYWGKLFQMLLTQISEKHVIAYFKDIDIQKAAESFDLAGRIVAKGDSAAVLKYDEGNGWDYFHLNNSNMAGAKSNMFVSEKITKDTTVNSDGTITSKVTIEYKNPYPGSDCNLERGGLCLNAPLRNWVRIYTPKGSKLTESKGTVSPGDGKVIPMDTYDSLEKTVFEGFLIVNPLGSARLDLTYTSPVKSIDGKYRLLIQKQPGTDLQQYLIRLNGKDRKAFPLPGDTELVF